VVVEMSFPCSFPDSSSSLAKHGVPHFVYCDVGVGFPDQIEELFAAAALVGWPPQLPQMCFAGVYLRAGSDLMKIQLNLPLRMRHVNFEEKKVNLLESFGGILCENLQLQKPAVAAAAAAAAVVARLAGAADREGLLQVS
jgi:hypothetical protein